MAELVRMKAFPSDMEEGVIVLWSKKESDTVSAGEAFCEVGKPIAVIGREGENISNLLFADGGGICSFSGRGWKSA